jgi:hypothetical protein
MECERAAKTRRVAPFDSLVGKLESRIAPKQGLEDDCSLCAHEARPEAIVDSAAERKVLFVGANRCRTYQAQGSVPDPD